MNLLLDTNILLYVARDSSGYRVLNFINPENKAIYISYANVAEIESLAFQNNWSAARLERLESFISAIRVIEMSDTFIRTYVEIDAFSQKKHPAISEYAFSTP